MRDESPLLPLRDAHEERNGWRIYDAPGQVSLCPRASLRRRVALYMRPESNCRNARRACRAALEVSLCRANCHDAGAGVHATILPLYDFSFLAPYLGEYMIGTPLDFARFSRRHVLIHTSEEMTMIISPTAKYSGYFRRARYATAPFALISRATSRMPAGSCIYAFAGFGAKGMPYGIAGGHCPLSAGDFICFIILACFYYAITMAVRYIGRPFDVQAMLAVRISMAAMDEMPPHKIVTPYSRHGL